MASLYGVEAEMPSSPTSDSCLPRAGIAQDIARQTATRLEQNARPVTAIRGAELDGNPATGADPVWNSFLVTPPFPVYISDHSTFSAAAATILARFFGSDHIAFAAGSDFLPDTVRQFTSFPRLPPKLPSAASTEGSTSGPQPKPDSLKVLRSANTAMSCSRKAIDRENN